MVPLPADSHVDVLIVGAGPAGLMAATWMSRCGIKTRIVDKRGTKIFNGQADGLQCRTLEIFDSFDFGHRVWREANHMLEVCLWNPDEQGVLRRSDRVADTPSDLSRFTEVVLHQGRIERFFLDSLKEYSDITVERGVLPESITLDDVDANDRKAYPITVKLQHLTEEEAIPAESKVHSNGSAIQNGLFRSNLAKDDTEDIINAAKKNPRAGSLETVKAKYVIGCDGAHSWVRRQLGFAMEGEQTDYIWGVLDIIPITDFPDIRMRCAIHSENSGSVMVIPRENKLVRLYIQLTHTEKGEGQYDRSQITPEMILKSAQKIMAPYKIEYTYCDWWTAYQIGQRVGSNFSKNERIFLAGDAVHTHSPKAGQGMNVSMQDTYNLGWKVALVAKGICDPSILKTYQSERRKIAQDLIDFDHKFSRLFSGRPAKNILDEEGISMEEFKNTFKKAQLFTSGIGVDYGASMIVAKEGDSTAQGDGTNVSAKKTQVAGKQSLSSVIKIGTRMPSFQVMNQADARPWQFQEILKSDGRWRIIVFAGNIKDPKQSARIHALGEALSQPESFLRRCTPADAPIDSIVEVLTIHSAPRQEVELGDFHEAFRPFQKGIGWDYWKVYVDDMSYHEGHGQAYKNYDVDPEKGCMVVLRPDMYVSWMGELEDTANMQNFFEGFLLVN